jgi:V8-like Glu-specific endopeptidase
VKDKPAILLSGYPKEQNLNSKKVAQYWGEMSFDSSRDNFVRYTKAFTGAGHSGSPLILKEDVEGKLTYSLVGVHKGNKGEKSISYGILLSQSKF